MTLTIDDPRWEAVLARDAQADGFVYSVATTGVYCRPACGARTPNRRNVAFHVDAAAAQLQEFRHVRILKKQLPGNLVVFFIERAAGYKNTNAHTSVMENFIMENECADIQMCN